MPSAKYWQERAEQRAQDMYDKYDNTFGELKALFGSSERDMINQIRQFYSKYGIDTKSPVFDDKGVIQDMVTKNVVTMADALKYGRLDSLIKKLDLTLRGIAKDQYSYMTTTLRELAQETDMRFMFDMFQGYGVGYGFDVLDPKVITEIINHPVNGENFSSRIWTNKNALSNRVNQTVRAGIAQGLSVNDMVKRISPMLYNKGEGTGIKNAERLMRTEITNTYNQATLTRYKEGGLVKQYEYLATLDNRTSSICQTLDGKVFNIDNAIVGLNYPPMHPNCRSTTLARFDDEVFERRARDEEGNAYTVPSNMKYADWKGKYT